MVAVYLQEEFGYSALTAGIGLVPFSLVLAVTGVMSGRLTSRFQLPTLLIVACVSMALGLAILSFVPVSYGYSGMVIPFLLIAAGAGPGFTLLNTVGLAAVSPERFGQATGMIYMFRFGGGAIGVAAASELHGAFFQRHLAFRLSETPLSFAQQKLLEQPGAAERIGNDRCRPDHKSGRTGPPGVSRVIRGGVHRHVASESDLAHCDRNFGGNNAKK